MLRVGYSGDKTNAYYAFLTIPHLPGLSYENYRTFRGNYLNAVLQVMKLKFPDGLDFVGIATEPRRVLSEDTAYMDARNWNIEREVEAKRLQDELKILTDTTPLVEQKVTELPE